MIDISTTPVQQRNDWAWLLMLNARNPRALNENTINFFRLYPATYRACLQRIDEGIMQVVGDE
jgi:hypothetical protein